MTSDKAASQWYAAGGSERNAGFPAENKQMHPNGKKAVKI